MPSEGFGANPRRDPIHGSQSDFPQGSQGYFPSRERVLISHCLANQSLALSTLFPRVPPPFPCSGPSTVLCLSHTITLLSPPQLAFALKFSGTDPQALSARPNCLWRKFNKTFLFFRSRWSLWSCSRFTTKQHLSNFSFRRITALLYKVGYHICSPLCVSNHLMSQAK